MHLWSAVCIHCIYKCTRNYYLLIVMMMFC